MSYADIVDPTNIHNDWQGTIRSAPLDLDILSVAVTHDIAQASGVTVRPSLSISCLDQVADGAQVYTSGMVSNMKQIEIVDAAERKVGISVSAFSSGPTRGDVMRK